MAKFFLGFALGAVLAGSVAGGIFWWQLLEMEQFHAEVLARVGMENGLDLANQVVKFHVPGVPVAAPGKTAAVEGKEETKVLEVAKSYIEDLEKFRFLRVYRAMTDEYQKKTPRDEFETMISKHKDLQNLGGEINGQVQYRVNKRPGDKGYDIYFTDTERFSVGRKIINVAMVLIKVDDEWRIDDLEISTSMK